MSAEKEDPAWRASIMKAITSVSSTILSHRNIRTVCSRLGKFWFVLACSVLVSKSVEHRAHKFINEVIITMDVPH